MKIVKKKGEGTMGEKMKVRKMEGSRDESGMQDAKGGKRRRGAVRDERDGIADASAKKEQLPMPSGAASCTSRGACARKIAVVSASTETSEQARRVPTDPSMRTTSGLVAHSCVHFEPKEHNNRAQSQHQERGGTIVKRGSEFWTDSLRTGSAPKGPSSCPASPPRDD